MISCFRFRRKVGYILQLTCSMKNYTTLPKRQILDCTELKEFADVNFKFDENGCKLSIRVENTMGKGEIARYEQFLLSRQCF